MCNVPFHFSFFFATLFSTLISPFSVFISVIRAWYCSARLVAFFCRRVFIKDKMIHTHMVRRCHHTGRVRTASGEVRT